MSPYLAVPIVLLFSLPAHAQVYKCLNDKQQVVYSDSACPAGNTEQITNIKLNAPQSNGFNNNSNLMRQLDGAVKSAILTGNLTKAAALATTFEQKQWVADAQMVQNNQPQKSEAMLKADMASSAACLSARRSLEKEANALLPDANVLEAKRSLMHSACGSSEPVIVQQPVQPRYVYGYPYRFRYTPHREYQKHTGHPYGTNHRPSIQLKPQQKSSTSSTHSNSFHIKSAR
ncbi:MAG: DUF4124 domain-containing protein [Methylophilaceae bacterium]|nr:DUF4124 domain-containing protein [Methylophilaceae bacterium]